MVAGPVRPGRTRTTVTAGTTDTPAAGRTSPVPDGFPAAGRPAAFPGVWLPGSFVLRPLFVRESASMRRQSLLRALGLPAALTAVALTTSPVVLPPRTAHAGSLCGTLADELAAERAGLEVEWRVSVPIDHTQGGIEQILIEDDLVVVQAGDGGVHAIHTGPVAPDGRCNPQVIWSVHHGSPGQPVVQGSIGAEMVMVARGNELWALDRSTGQIRWQRHLARSPIAGGAVVGEWVYQPQGAATVLRVPANPWRDTGIRPAAPAAGSRRRPGSATADKTGKGKPVSQLSDAEKRARMDATESLEPMQLNGGGTIERAMIPFGEGVLWTTRDGTIVSLQQGDRDWQREEFRLDSPQAGPLATRGAAIFAATRARDLARIDSLEAGSELRLAWRVLLDGQPEEDGPFVAGDRVIVSLGDDGLRCYSTENGDLLWANRCPGRILAVAADRIWVEDRTSHLSSFDLATGEPISCYTFGPFTRMVVNHATDRLILAADSGTIVCLKARGAGAPKAWADLEPLPRPEEGEEKAPARPATVEPDPPAHLRGDDLFDEAPAGEADAADDAGMDDAGMDTPEDAGDTDGFGDEAPGADPFEARDS